MTSVRLHLKCADSGYQIMFVLVPNMTQVQSTPGQVVTLIVTTVSQSYQDFSVIGW